MDRSVHEVLQRVTRASCVPNKCADLSELPINKILSGSHYFSSTINQQLLKSYECACKRFTVDVGLLLLNVASDPDNVKMSEYAMLFLERASLM